MNKETFAIIGYGSIGKRHAANLAAARPNAKLIVVDPARIAGVDFQGLGQCLTAYPYLAGALVCSPHEAHLEALEQLTEARIPVYLEKPVCAVAQYAANRQKLVRLAEQGVPVALGFQYRYHTIADQLYPMRADILRLEFTARDNLADRYGPTVLETMASHSIDLALFLLGPAYVVKLVTNGLRANGRVLHEHDRESHFDLGIDGARPGAGRESEIKVTLKSQRTLHMLIDVDQWMYPRCLADWLRWITAGERAARLATLKDGLAVQDVLSAVKMIKQRKAVAA